MTISKFIKRLKRLVLASLAYSSRYVLPQGLRVSKNPPESILIVSTTGYGDTLWSIPAIKKVRQQFPSAYIAVLTGKVSYEILRYCPWIDEFFHYSTCFDTFFDVPRLLKNLHSRRFDRTFFLHYSDSTVVPLCMLVQARGFYGSGGSLRGFEKYFDYVAPTIQHDFIERRMSAIGSTDHSEADKDIEIFLDREDVARKNSFLTSKGLNSDENRLWLGFQVGSRLKQKEWPKDNFIELGQRCVREEGVRIFVFGSPAEKSLINSVVSQIPDSISVLDPCVSLRASMAIIQEMDAFVTNDTGPMHVALAKHIPTVALFGCTPIFSCGHYTYQPHVRVIKSPSDDDLAITEIGVKQVWDQLTDLLSEHGLSQNSNRNQRA